MINKTIAWIEDDSDEIAAVVKPLRGAGFEFKCFYHYAGAIARTDEIRNCDLILLDLILPMGPTGEDSDPALEAEDYLGKLLLRRFRREFGIHTPVIVLSVAARRNVFDEHEIEDLKITLIPKPARPSKLKAEVYRLLNLDEE
ncbi:MAG: hypothetical protein ACREEM_01385 [Blastocatellia bacterium]